METMLDGHQKMVQSLELMKIVLHITLAGILFKRNLLPWIVFGERGLSIPKLSVPEISHVHTYKDFISDDGSKNDDSTFKVTVMERGKDSKTDHVLDLLEGSIFEALMRRHLHAAQFSIIEDREQPLEVLESYIISFAYDNAQRKMDKGKHVDPNDHVQDNAENSVAPVAFSVNVRKGIRHINRLLTPLTASFTKLPSVRALGVFLTYTENCPKEYQVPDFTDADNVLLKAISEEKLGKRTICCGGIGTGLHSASLKVTYTHQLTRSASVSSINTQPSVKPAEVNSENFRMVMNHSSQEHTKHNEDLVGEGANGDSLTHMQDNRLIDPISQAKDMKSPDRVGNIQEDAMEAIEQAPDFANRAISNGNKRKSKSQSTERYHEGNIRERHNVITSSKARRLPFDA
ncbi:hypothetical protein N7532_011986 [Penicillium argentinense]|uniref:HORMA domain-containing protein n=1 Tax=Penicillium argentinense TaxID=1131581 RepID=A0A9W9EJI8_9EURO|nr:uncharacterized protein N7532_011986 [Penicillium argentinense]KAJ5082943.1 hypothetical protein N7532_011986 [Penicillium argentinense]